ncbi:hypothetical protein LINPERPRIM_LOCUS45307 [Linum perenne]
MLDVLNWVKFLN